MNPLFSNHVRSDRLGEAAKHASLDGLRDVERRHFQACPKCQQLYGGYRLTDRLLAAHWEEAKLPVEAVSDTSRWRLLAALPRGLGSRSLVPAFAAMALVLLVGVGVVLPQLLPAAPTPAVGSQVSRSSAPASSSASPSPTATPSRKPGTSPSKGSGGGSATPTPGGSGSLSPIAMTQIQGEPMAWSPDGRYLLVARSAGGQAGQHQVQIRDAAGILTGSCAGDDAAWVDSTTIAVATRGSHGAEATVSLVGLNGHRKATLPGTYSENSATMALNGGMLIGSGHGQLAIADQGGGNGSEPSFVVWNGRSLSSPKEGVPIAWSADGSRLAVLQAGGRAGANVAHDPGFAGSLRATGPSISGSLQVLSFPGLQTIVSINGSFRVSAGSPVYGYGLDASFSPNGRRLLISGTLVDLGTRSTRQAGQGDWLPDGTLVSVSGGNVLRWQSGHSTRETRLPGGGVIETSNHGDVIEYFSDSRPPLLLTAEGRVYRLALTGVATIESLLLSPDGSAVAFNGRAPGGSPVAAVATLR
jgi:hypothetical protein